MLRRAACFFSTRQNIVSIPKKHPAPLPHPLPSLRLVSKILTLKLKFPRERVHIYIRTQPKQTSAAFAHYAMEFSSLYLIPFSLSFDLCSSSRAVYMRQSTTYTLRRNLSPCASLANEMSSSGVIKQFEEKQFRSRDVFSQWNGIINPSTGATDEQVLYEI